MDKNWNIIVSFIIHVNFDNAWAEHYPVTLSDLFSCIIILWHVHHALFIFTVFSIQFSSSAYTVSEDDSFIDLTITKTLVDDTVSSNQQSITVLF